MSDVHDRAKKGVRILLARHVVLQVITTTAGIVLPRLVDAAEYGLYGIAVFIVQTSAILDLGLGIALVQRREALSGRDLAIAFTIQQVLITLLVAALWLSAPLIASFYPDAPPEMVWFIRTLSFTLYLQTWRTPSTVQLERELRYVPLAIAEIADVLLFNVLAIALAAAGYGTWALILASLTRSVVGTAILYAASPWSVRVVFAWGESLRMLKGSIAFQLQSLVNALSGWVVPIVVGGRLGPAAVGILTFAQGQGNKPLQVAGSVMRVAYPHLARLQDAPDEFERVTSRYLSVMLWFSAIWFGTLAIAGEQLVAFVFTEKWLPAVPALVIYAFGTSAEVVGWTLGLAMNASGRVANATRIVLLRNLSGAALSLGLVYWIGYLGAPLGQVAAATLAAPLFFVGWRAGAARNILKGCLWIVPALALAMASGWAFARWSPLQDRHGFAIAAVTGVCYLFASRLLAPPEVRAMVKLPKFLRRSQPSPT